MFARPAVRFTTLTLLLVLAQAATPATGAAPGKPTPQSKSGQVAAETKVGRQLFEDHCAFCHGLDGRGGRGPGLNRPVLSHAPTNGALKDLISNGLPPEMPASWYLNDSQIADLVIYVRSLSKVVNEPLTGDASRGAQLYAKGACGGCHILAGTGNAFGPELTRITLERSPSHVKATIANPAANLPDTFLLIHAITAKGEKIEGIRINEDSFTIQIRTAAGQFLSLRKIDLRDLQKLRNQSPMPSYEKLFSPSELDDLVAYLASVRSETRGKD
jgi:cytochrome c oxidase cbb3-type subunit III